MEKYSIRLEKQAKKDLMKLYKSGQKLDVKKVEQILLELEKHPRTGIGNPERLKYKDGEFWSRSINKKDRIIYEILEDFVLVIVLSALGHYEDQ